MILFGQTTFGKGSIQGIIPLKKDKALGGIRITIAKFTSPSKKEYANLGVTPHRTIDAFSDGMTDLVFNMARDDLKKSIPPERMPSDMMRMMMPQGGSM